MDEKRFSKLRFPVHKYGPSEDLKKLDAFRVLFSYPEFDEFGKEDPERLKLRNKLIRYICFLYDPNSDLIEDFPSLQDRKEAAAVEAGLKRTQNGDGDWPEAIQGFFDFSDAGVVGMILRFLKQFPEKNFIWREIATLEMELEKYTEQRWSQETDSGKNQFLFIDQCDKIRGKLKILYKEFTMGDKSLEEKIILERVTPENVMRILAQGDVPSN